MAYTLRGNRVRIISARKAANYEIRYTLDPYRKCPAPGTSVKLTPGTFDKDLAFLGNLRPNFRLALGSLPP